MKANRQFQSVPIVSLHNFKSRQEREKLCPSSDRKNTIYLGGRTFFNNHGQSFANISKRYQQIKSIDNELPDVGLHPNQSSTELFPINSVPRQKRQLSTYNLVGKPQMRPLIELKKKEKDRLSQISYLQAEIAELSTKLNLTQTMAPTQEALDNIKESIIKEREQVKKKHDVEIENFYKKYNDMALLTKFYENEIMELKSLNVEYLKTIKQLEAQLDQNEQSHKTQINQVQRECAREKVHFLQSQEELSRLQLLLQDNAKQTERFYRDLNALNKQNQKLESENLMLKKMLDEKEKFVRENYSIQKLRKLNGIISKHSSLTQGIKESMQCKFCSSLAQDPVTVIPCAHTYCKQCSSGYTTICHSCGPQVEIESVYQNDLVKEFIRLYQQIEDFMTESKALIAGTDLKIT